MRRRCANHGRSESPHRRPYCRLCTHSSDGRQKTRRGAVHAGWRGTVAAIVRNTMEKMHADFGSNPADIRAALGPCIRQCCYEVGPEVAAQFSPLFPELTSSDRQTAYRPSGSELPPSKSCWHSGLPNLRFGALYHLSCATFLLLPPRTAKSRAHAQRNFTAGLTVPGSAGNPVVTPVCRAETRLGTGVSTF